MMTDRLKLATSGFDPSMRTICTICRGTGTVKIFVNPERALYLCREHADQLATDLKES
jgi:hypothetical protein